MPNCNHETHMLGKIISRPISTLTVSISNSNSCICSALPTISPMAHSIVSGRSVRSWTEIFLGRMSFSSVGNRFHARGAATENARSPNRRSVRGRKVAVAGGAQRRACWYVGDRCEQVEDAAWWVAGECQWQNENKKLCYGRETRAMLCIS